jgi:RimJ/RimL family protein N-acetyltransferase
VRIETERLVIRPWSHRPDDLDRLVDLYSRPSLVRYIGWMREPVGHLVDEWDRRMADDHRQVVGAIEVRETGVVAGTVMYILLPGGHHMEVGWHLHPDSERRGYATEAGRAVIARGFHIGVPEVFALVKPDNPRSQAVARRLGMRHLGRTTRYHETEFELFHLAAPQVDGRRGNPRAASGRSGTELAVKRRAN